MKSSINIEHKIALPNIIFFSIADLIENNLSGNIYILIATLVSILVKNSMSCHSSAFTHCHKLIHLSVTDSGAITPDF